jgi:hypothetical protein
MSNQPIQPSTDQEVYSNSVVQALTNQRNAALNDVVTLSAQNAVQTGQIESLRSFVQQLQNELSSSQGRLAAATAPTSIAEVKT